MSAWGSLAEIGRVGRERLRGKGVGKGHFPLISHLVIYIENCITENLSPLFLYALCLSPLVARTRNL